MKISVEISDSELRRVCSITGERKKGPAIRKVLENALRQHRREEIAQKFLTGEWSAESAGYEAAKQADRQTAQTLDSLWRD